MNLKSFIAGKNFLAVLTSCFFIALIALGFREPGFPQKRTHADTSGLDTIPKNKDSREKKIRDLDDVLLELNNVDLKIEMEKVQKEINEALKNINSEKIRLDLEKSLKDVDFQKIQKEIELSMSKIDWEKMRKDLDELRNVDMAMLEKEMKKMQEEMKDLGPRLQKEMEEFKKIDMVNLQEEMRKVEVELKTLGPKLEKELEEAKIEIEKDKKLIQEYKEFVDGLEKDGLIDKSKNYTIKHNDGELIINDKTQPAGVYNKYRNFLEKNKSFSIEKSEDYFDIDID